MQPENNLVFLLGIDTTKLFENYVEQLKARDVTNYQVGSRRLDYLVKLVKKERLNHEVRKRLV